MAEDLADGEFWLPSHFLTDDDILMDLDISSTTHAGSSSSISDLDFISAFTETESDEDDILLAGLTHQMSRSSLRDSSCPVHSKGCGVLSSSPQSTLFGCVCNQSSSRESASPPQLQQHAEVDYNKNNDNINTATSTLDLLNKAAGEVARLKLRTEKKLGTGFFDCSQKGVSYPQPLKNLEHFPPLYFQPQFLHFPPHMVWPLTNPNAVQFNQPTQKQPPPPQNRATKSDNKSKNKNTTSNNNNNNNRPLGLPPSAWPPLQAQPPTQAQSKAQRQTMPPVIVGPAKGTGVFLPRCVASPANETRKKTDGNTTKSKSGKGLQSQSNHRRNSSKTSTTATTANHIDIQLPQEWTY